MTPVSHLVDSTIYLFSISLVTFLLTDSELPAENNQLDLKNMSMSAQFSVIIVFSLIFHNISLYTSIDKSNEFWNDDK